MTRAKVVNNLTSARMEPKETSITLYGFLGRAFFDRCYVFRVRICTGDLVGARSVAYAYANA